jgi:hypothetical protein
VTVVFLPGWITRVDPPRVPVETLNNARVEFGSLIKTGASSASVFACTTLSIQSQQITPPSVRDLSRQKASDKLIIIFP